MYRAILLLVAVGVLGACQADRYPLTGEACGPDDPVRELRVPPCPGT